MKLFLLDYIVEHDDRHAGNIGILRCSETGKILSQSLFYDFNWCFSGYSVDIPLITFYEYSHAVEDFINRVTFSTAMSNNILKK